jgi:hypothetical protein
MYNPLDLTAEDITVLIDACDAWVNKHLLGDFTGTVIGIRMAKDEKGRQAFAAKKEREQFAREIEMIKSRETATLLKAKLIQMRRNLTAQDPQIGTPPPPPPVENELEPSVTDA